ncbi:DUF6188 family protein [Kitasatospora cinereorecta]|uniref:DUF6188 family protein n=1 Tax=Kitasatospora cinereorecta TaxID=285560 RepID=A0ABW0VCC0_9ACTN
MAHPIDSVLAGRRVEDVTGGLRLTLRLSGALEVGIENDFRLTGPAEVEHFYPALGMRPTGGLPTLLDARLTAAHVTPAGALVLAFDTRHTLTVAPDTAPGGPEHAWTVTGPTGPLFTALPGGYLTA